MVVPGIVYRSVDKPDLHLDAEDVWPCERSCGRQPDCPECRGHGLVHGYGGPWGSRGRPVEVVEVASEEAAA